MRALLAVSTAVLALAIASSAQAQNIQPGMMPKGSSYNPHGPQTRATGLTQDLLAQASSQLAASVASQILPGALALAPKTNANLPGYAAWNTAAGGFNPIGAKSAGAGMGIGVLAGIALNPESHPIKGALIAAGSTAYGALLAHSWASVPIKIKPKVLGAASGLAAAQTLAAGGARWLLQDQPSATKAVGSGLAASGATAIIATVVGSGPAAPAIIVAGVCATAICAAGDAITGNWKEMGGAPKGIAPAPPPPPPPTAKVIAPPPPPANGPADPTGAPTTIASNSNQDPGQQPQGNSTGTNTNTSGGQQAGSPSANGSADPTGAPTSTASNSNQNPGPAGNAGPNTNASGTRRQR